MDYKNKIETFDLTRASNLNLDSIEYFWTFLNILDNLDIFGQLEIFEYFGLHGTFGDNWTFWIGLDIFGLDWIF